MKYLTKEELENISTSLINMPTYDKLKELTDALSSKYEINKQVEPLPNANINKPVVEPIPNTYTTPPVTPLNNTPTNNMTVPSFELPKINTQEQSQNNTPINFTGNLWEPERNNLMGTTDNFRNAEVNNNQAFNIPNQNTNMMPNQNQGPSMFGQFEQSYNKTA